MSIGEIVVLVVTILFTIVFVGYFISESKAIWHMIKNPQLFDKDGYLKSEEESDYLEEHEERRKRD